MSLVEAVKPTEAGRNEGIDGCIVDIEYDKEEPCYQVDSHLNCKENVGIFAWKEEEVAPSGMVEQEH